MSTKHASTTLTAVPDPVEVGSVVADLLKQVPTALADALLEAIGDDLAHVFSIGMSAGEHVVWSALEQQGITVRPKPAPVSKRHLTLVGGAR